MNTSLLYNWVPSLYLFICHCCGRNDILCNNHCWIQPLVQVYRAEYMHGLWRSEWTHFRWIGWEYRWTASAFPSQATERPCVATTQAMMPQAATTDRHTCTHTHSNWTSAELSLTPRTKDLHTHTAYLIHVWAQQLPLFSMYCVPQSKNSRETISADTPQTLQVQLCRQKGQRKAGKAPS